MTVDEKAIRDLREDVISLRDENRRLRADLDMLRSGRGGTLGWKGNAGLVRENGIITRLIKDAAVTDAKIDSLSVRKLLAGDIEVEFDITTGALTWADGTGKLNIAGIQLESDLSGSYLPVIVWLNDFVDTAAAVSTTYPRSVIEGFTTDIPTADIRMVAASSVDIQSFLQLTEGQAILNADDNGIAATQITLNCSAVSGRRILISNAPVIFAYWTSDPTDGLGAVDGALIYRTDTDKFRARVNGAWVNLLTSADSVFSWSLSTTAGNHNAAMVTGEVLVYTGTGGHTLAMNASANAFLMGVKNRGSGTFTLVPAGAETIDGLTSWVLAPGDSAFLFGASGNWVIV